MTPRDQAGRIRLEGRLEVIEHVAAALQNATRELANATVHGVQDAVALRLAPETTSAEAAVRRLAGQHSEVDAALVRLEIAWTALDRALARRVARLGSPGVSVQAAAQLVEAEPIRYSGVATLFGHTPFVLSGAAMLAFLGAAAFFTSPYVLLVAVLALAYVGLVQVVPGIEPLLLTERRLRVGTDVFSIASVRSVRVDYELPIWLEGKRRPVRLGLVHAAGDVTWIRLPEFPAELRRQLVRMGIWVL
jgi:hypothetical protein